MSRSLNKVMLIGNVGNDPEIRSTTTGTRVAKVSLATNDYAGKDASGQAQEKANWHRLTFFGRLADVVEQWVKKGDRLYCEGRLDYSQTEDPQGGTRYWTDIIVNDMVMLGSSGGGEPGGSGGRSGGFGGSGGGGGGGGGSGTGGDEPPLSEPDDDLPF